MKKYPEGVHKYIIDGETVFAEYIGRQKGFECCICGKGCNAFTFNILHGNTIEDAIKNYREHMDYETWGFGPTHIKDAVKLDSLN